MGKNFRQSLNQHTTMDTDSKNTRGRLVLEAAHSAWARMAPVRARRRRYARYTYGDQWSDPVRRRNGTVTTEGERPLQPDIPH